MGAEKGTGDADADVADAQADEDGAASDKLSAAAEEVFTALSLAAQVPLPQLRQAQLGGVLHLVHERLRAAEERHASHRVRTLARTMSAFLGVIRRPHLSKAKDSHKALPLLLGWSDLIDVDARGETHQGMSPESSPRSLVGPRLAQIVTT